MACAEVACWMGTAILCWPNPLGRPAHISARGVHGKILRLAGPWRICGDWWTDHPWARDEWDVAVSDGALYRIYFERISGRWFVEGSYD